jgi:hypothetical protein
MGSSGSGNFSDYSSTPAKKRSSKKKPSKGGGGGSSGGASGKDPCSQPIVGIGLDEVGRSEYYAANKALPAAGSSVFVRKKLFHGRIAVENDQHQVIGLLPTQYNFLIGCVNDGYSYQGSVNSSSTTPYPRIKVDIHPA